ncbi:MAG: hypothetical protein ABIG90_02075, partial [bacterium]
ARVDFAGGWTDNSAYPLENPAAVLNAGIDCLGIKISISPAKQFQVNQDSDLLRASLNFLNLENPAIKIDIQNSIPVGSGLGGSGLLIYGLLAGILSCQDKKIDKIELINSVIEVEKMLGSCGGWNDTSSLINPGITLTQTSPDKSGQYIMQNMLDPEFEKLCLLVNTGVSRNSIDFNIIKKQYSRGDKKTINALKLARDSALHCWGLLLAKKYFRFARLISRAWGKICEIEPKMRIPEVDEIENIIGKNLAGGKLCGAGGGGFYLAILRDAQNRELVIRRLKNKFQVYKPKFNKCLQIKKLRAIKR